MSATFIPDIKESGNYDVRLLYTTHENRSSRTAVTIYSGEGEKTIRIDQRRSAVVDGQVRSLGVFRFEAGGKARVVVTNDGADGIVVVDGLQLVVAP